MSNSINIVEEFKKLTKKDITPFLNKCSSFFQTDYNTLKQYYAGDLSSIDSQIYETLKELSQERDEIITLINSHSHKMKNLFWWTLTETIDDIDSRLNGVSNINKWSRSSMTSVSYSPSTQVDYTLQERQTLERVSKDVLGSANPQDDWIDIALNNNLNEESYNSSGGNSLLLQLDKTVNIKLNVKSVVDVLYGKSIYGKDLKKKLQFEDNDLVVLDYDDTIFQAVEILSLLKKNDNPDYPSLGLQSSIVVGSNRVQFNSPVISRQLSETFASDDTLKGFQINSIDTEQDNVTISFQVKTRLDEIIDQKIIM